MNNEFCRWLILSTNYENARFAIMEYEIKRLNLQVDAGEIMMCLIMGGLGGPQSSAVVASIWQKRHGDLQLSRGNGKLNFRFWIIFD